VKNSLLLPVLIFLCAAFATRFGLGLAQPPSLARAGQAKPAFAGSVAKPLAAQAPATGQATVRARSGVSPDADTREPSRDSGLATASSPSVSKGAVAALAARFADAGTPADLLRDADLSDPAVRAYVVARLSEMQEERQEAALVKAERLGIPLRIEGPGRKVSVLYDFRGDRPLYRVTLNVNAALSTGANLLRDQAAPYGLDGTGMKVGVWDEARVRNTHREFTTTRVVLKDSSTTFSDHATHVAGTIGAAGTAALAKGMAPKVAIDSYDWNSDYTEMTAAGAATATDTTRLTVSNHSYGVGFETAAEYVPYMGAYETEASTTDALAGGLPYYQIFWAAGNEQDYLTTKGGYQSITFNGLAKNVITIAAGNDAIASGVRSPSAGSLAYFSSQGPCDDGRIKPDLTANGVDLYSSVAFTPPAGTASSTTSYDTYSGTSMATPNAVGSSILLQQLYTREFPGQRLRASALKALLINTADDVGRAGPDYQYGWGYLNAKAAADLILAHKASLASPKLIEGTLSSATKTRTHTFTWDGVSPIRATLCWTDPAGVALDPTVAAQVDVRTPNLVNDLDLKITAPDGTTVSLPYVMPFVGTWTDAAMLLPAVTGVNRVDNVEQVRISNPSQAGNYTITVTVPGALTGASQVYSLAVTGGTNVEANPAPVAILEAPVDGTVILPGVPVILSATATDKVAGGGAGVVTGVGFFNGATSLGVDTTAPYSLSWTPPAADVYTLTVKATDSEGAVGTSAITHLTVLSGDGTPTLAAFTPSSGTAGDSVAITGTNFAAVTAVKFNGVDAFFTVASPTSLSAIVPATATTGTIAVTTARGSATSANSFTVTQNPVLISQVYGGGGRSGAPYNADYVELYNRGATAVSLAGWSVQYASASGSTWQTTALSGTIAAGKHYLVKLASNGATGSALPAADATGAINLSGTNGKVALRNTAAAFTGSTPTGQTGLLDLVGYGTANAFEGSAAPVGSNTTALFRADGGATDTANNAADFSAAAPNPRNSNAGQPVAPVISSATTASGTVNQAFSHQIAASNSPTGFAANGLPAGLTVNTTNGLISGTPSAAGVSSVTISATNAAGTGSATLTLTIVAAAGGGSVTIFSENMGTSSGTTVISANVFQSTAPIVFTGTADVRSTTVSSGYAGASGARNVFITNAVGTSFTIAGINTSRYTNLSLSLGHFKSTTAGSNELVIEVSPDGTTFSPLAYTRATGSGTAAWSLITPTGTIPATVNLRIRFRQTSSGPQFRIDDVVLKGDAASAAPAISATGALATVGATYGTASSTTTFTVSGANLTAPILVTPPAGFEVSQTVGGGSDYAPTQTVGAAGTVPATTIYLRLAAGTPVGTYSGNIVCSSAGATSVNVATVASAVSAKDLIVTAQNRIKSFGTTLTLGTSAFDTTGLVPGETVGAVTLTATGGTAANDAAGAYVITPSAATGGTFTPGNYTVSYQPGVLTVTAPTFAGWSAGLTDPAAAADPDHDGVANLLEYFFGLNAAAADTVAPQVSVVGSELRMDYRRSKALNGVSGAAEWTTGLGGTPVWSTAGVTDTQVSDQGAYEIRRAAVTFTAGEPIKFLRLRVSQP